MNIRTYAQEMGCHIIYDLAPSGFRCRIKDFRLADSCGNPEAAADGSTEEAAREALVHFIAGRILRSALRATTFFWVPSDLKP